MKCPHCSEGIHEVFATRASMKYHPVFREKTLVALEINWALEYQRCPECHGLIVYFRRYAPDPIRYPVHPRASSRPCPSDALDPYRQDFKEACDVLPLSAKASAAISRRLLQSILREKEQTKSKDLVDQIHEVIAANTLPGHIAEGLHAVRVIGNFAAHPTKSKNTGEIVEVEPGEAEWNLDVVGSLFDFYFVQPELTKKRKAKLNAKLTAAGKPTI